MFEPIFQALWTSVSNETLLDSFIGHFRVLTMTTVVVVIKYSIFQLLLLHSSLSLFILRRHNINRRLWPFLVFHKLPNSYVLRNMVFHDGAWGCLMFSHPCLPILRINCSWLPNRIGMYHKDCLPGWLKPKPSWDLSCVSPAFLIQR